MALSLGPVGAGLVGLGVRRLDGPPQVTRHAGEGFKNETESRAGTAVRHGSFFARQGLFLVYCALDITDSFLSFAFGLL